MHFVYFLSKTNPRVRKARFKSKRRRFLGLRQRQNGRGGSKTQRRGRGGLKGAGGQKREHGQMKKVDKAEAPGGGEGSEDLRG